MKKGFTLIELLVVISIIGLLSSVVLASLNSGKSKARISSALVTMRSVQNGAIICVNEGLTLATPTATQNGGGAVLCSGSTTRWTILPTGWTYSVTISSNGTAGTFSFSSSGDSKTITCTQTGCTVS